MANKVPLRPATLGVQSPTPASADAIVFGPEHIPAQFFEMTNEQPSTWLDSGSGLLRASRAVARQSAIDNGALKAWFAMPDAERDPTPPVRAHVEMQAAFLGALSVENGLKALIAANLMAAGPSSATPANKLWVDFLGHDLVDLAGRALFVTGDSAENEALAAGQYIIEGFGRYATLVKADRTPTTYSMKPGALFDAYDRLFFQCVTWVARVLHPRVGHGKTVDDFVSEHMRRHENATGGVSPAWGGEEQIALRGGAMVRTWSGVLVTPIASVQLRCTPQKP
jgi:hypothetical protein